MGDKKLALHDQLDLFRSFGQFHELPSSVTQNLSDHIKLRPYQKDAFSNFLHYEATPEFHKDKQTHLLFHMATGAGKTRRIVERCVNNQQGSKRPIVLAFTENGQAELKSRLAAQCPPGQLPHVMGWYAFLIQHVIKPYLPVLFPNQRICGFDFHAKLARYTKRENSRRFFTSNDQLNKCHIEELASLIILAMQGKVQERLARIYCQLIIDEVQDISEYGLDVIRAFLEQEYLQLFMVGDTMQTILNSNTSLNKNKNVASVARINWYTTFQANHPHLLTIEEMSLTYRSNTEIVSFSNTIMDPGFGFAPTYSAMTQVTGHDGVFLVKEEDIDTYEREYHPTYIRWDTKSADSLKHLPFMTFGKAKGLEWDRVAIYMTGTMLELLGAEDTYLKPQTACKFYVGVTRARYSVALIVPKGKKLVPHDRFRIEPWEPSYVNP
ncbi:AAA family ATPase [Rothia sp. P7208]|uniref:AAA family ATPase n=1 Tax=Rothia sp. P7208 TaxID=3402660 RepID=UPI003AD7779A